MKNSKLIIRFLTLFILVGGFTCSSVLTVHAEDKKVEQTKEETKEKVKPGDKQQAGGDEEPECD